MHWLTSTHCCLPIAPPASVAQLACFALVAQPSPACPTPQPAAPPPDALDEVRTEAAAALCGMCAHGAGVAAALVESGALQSLSAVLPDPVEAQQLDAAQGAPQGRQDRLGRLDMLQGDGS